VAFKPSAKRKAPEENVEPNITPIMNLMVVLIPMLLSVAQFVQLSLLEYLPPPIEDVASEGGGGGEGGSGPALMDLLVNVGDNGFEVSLFGDNKGENFRVIPKLPDGSYDFDGLHAELVRIKTQIVGQPIDVQETEDPRTGKTVRREIFKYEDANKMNVAAKGDIPWQFIVHVLDAARDYEDENGAKKPLFPSPLLGQIQ